MHPAIPYLPFPRAVPPVPHYHGRFRPGSFPIPLFLLLLVCIPLSCSLLPVRSPGEVSVLAWNLQNLFDASPEGNEYAEFRDPSWTFPAYRARLDTFSAILAGCRDLPGGMPGVMVLCEVENAGVVEDLARAVRGKVPSWSPGWCGAAPVSPGQAVTMGVIASHPPAYQKAHRVWVDGQTSRVVWELHFPPDAEGCGPLVVFANHWKSKSGGAGETEALRRAAAELVRSRTACLQAEFPGALVVCAGDLNTQGLPGESEGRAPALSLPGGDPRGILLLRSPGGTEGDPDSARSWNEPWIPLEEGGSYRYQGEWERIDHLLYRGGAHWALEGFGVPDLPGLTGTDGGPVRWDMSTRRGVSDHLPLLGQWKARESGD